MLESSLTVIVTVISGVIVYVLTELLKEDERRGHMDLLAYAQIEEYENLLKNNQIEIPRLRGIDPCESMKPWTDEECRRSIERIRNRTCEDLYTAKISQVGLEGYYIGNDLEGNEAVYFLCSGELIDLDKSGRRVEESPFYDF